MNGTALYYWSNEMTSESELKLKYLSRLLLRTYMRCRCTNNGYVNYFIFLKGHCVWHPFTLVNAFFHSHIACALEQFVFTIVHSKCFVYGKKVDFEFHIYMVGPFNGNNERSGREYKWRKLATVFNNQLIDTA